jgi:hypothetical protein
VHAESAKESIFLDRVTLAYAALPFLIFSLGWLRPQFGVPAATLLLVGIWRASRREETRSLSAHEANAPRPGVWERLATRDVAVLVGLAVLVGGLALYSGAGGWAYQYQDYSRHNAFLADLMEYPWPLAFEATPPSGKPGVLAFYIANALPSATLGRWFGWEAANTASLVWTGVGLYLAVLWFMRVVGRTSFGLGVLFLFFGGLDIVGRTALLGFPSDLTRLLGNWMVEYSVGPAILGEPIRLSGIFFYYPSNLSFIYYAPQHALGPWLCVLMILYDAIRAKTCRRSVLLLSLIFLWSAFAFLGTIPILLAAIWLTRGRGLMSFENVVVGGTVGILTFLYVGSNNADYVHGFLWAAHDLRELLPFLFFFYAVEFGLYALIVPRPGAGEPNSIDPFWLRLAVVCLIAAPWYVLGQFNDLTTKVSIPGLLVLQVYLGAALVAAKPGTQRLRAYVLIGLLVVGSMAALSDVGRGVTRGLDWKAPKLTQVQHANDFKRLGGQLFSDGKGFFWTYIAKPPEYQ